MLVLLRKQNESVVIDSEITVTVLDVRGDLVLLGITAPKDVSVNRAEVQQRIENNVFVEIGGEAGGA